MNNDKNKEIWALSFNVEREEINKEGILDDLLQYALRINLRLFL